MGDDGRVRRNDGHQGLRQGRVTLVGLPVYAVEVAGPEPIVRRGSGHNQHRR